MADLSTKYLGLNLKNPIIAGSTGLTNSLKDISKLEAAGAGAVVLKSLFEEEIIKEMEESHRLMTSPMPIYPEIYDEFDYDTVEDSVSKYIALISELKQETSIPVIASVNCVSSHEWPSFAKRFEEAGADALELNVFIPPSDFDTTSSEKEKVYFDVIKNVKKEVTIPVSLKISYYFTNLGTMIQDLSETEVDGLVLFNRFYSPDFDIDNFRVVPANIFSNASNLPISLRWIAIMAGRAKCDLAASTGIHDGSAVIKQILAGAKAVQVASALYKSGPEIIHKMVQELESWMDKHSFENISQFRGKMSQSLSLKPDAYERTQFMKHFSEKL